MRRIKWPAQWQCCFMIDNGEGVKDPKFRWCRKRTVPGKPYCADHCAVCYRQDEAA